MKTFRCTLIIMLSVINALYSQNQIVFKVQKNKQDDTFKDSIQPIIRDIPQVQDRLDEYYKPTMSIYGGGNNIFLEGLYDFYKNVFYKYASDNNNDYKELFNSCGNIGISFSYKIKRINRVNSIEYVRLLLFRSGGSCFNDYNLSSCELNGYYILDNFNIIPDVFFKERWIDLRHYVGIGYGNYRFKMSEGNDDEDLKVYYTNPAILLNTSIELRLNTNITKKLTFTIGCKGGGLLDISKRTWKKEKEDLVDIPKGDNMTGFYGHLLLSFSYGL